MIIRWNAKLPVLAAVLLGGVLAASSYADAASPWFRPGGARQERRDEPGRREGERDREGGRDWERRNKMYREQNFIRQLYQGFLNRQPSSAEMRYWEDKFGADADPAELVREFMDSDEFFIRESFRGLLGREPDAGGMNFYTGWLRSGRSRADVVESLLSSDEFRSRLDGRRPRRR